MASILGDYNMAITVGGGGGFVTRFVSGIQVITSGASGDILTLTPPSGQKVMVTDFVATALETGLTVTIDGSDIITGQSTRGFSSTNVGEFGVGLTQSSGSVGGQVPITGGTDEVIVFKKDAGSTGVNINYQYQFGE